MIRAFSNRFLRLQTEYADPLDRQRARVLLYLHLSATLINIVLVALIFLTNIFNREEGLNASLLLSVASIPLTLFMYQLVQSGFLRASSYILVTLSLLGMIVTMLDGITDANTVVVALPLITSSLLLRWPGLIISTALTIIATILAAFGQPPAPNVIPAMIIIIISVLFMTGFLLAIGTSLQQIVTTSVRDLSNLRRLASLLNFSAIDTTERELITRAINSLRDALDYNAVQIYMVTGNQIDRRYSSSLKATAVILDNEVSVAAGSGIRETLRTRALQRLNLSSSPALRSHFIAGTSVGMTVPVPFRDEIVAIIDVQRSSDFSISASEQQGVELVASQLGTALAQARVINDLRENITDQQRIISQQRGRLRALDAVERETAMQAWTKYMAEQGSGMMGFDLTAEAEQMLQSTNLPRELRPALETGQITVQEEDEMQLVSVPIELRGETLGAMSFKVPRNQQQIGNRQIEMIRNVVQRLGLALENKRLFEQSQSQAQRESKANEIGNELLSTTDMETVLRMAADSFNEALGAIQTQIYLQPQARDEEAEERV